MIMWSMILKKCSTLLLVTLFTISIAHGGQEQPPPSKPQSPQSSTPDVNQTRPIPLNRPKPDYTEEARQQAVEGIIRLRVLVGIDGTVKQVRAVNQLPHGLTDQAIKAAFEIKFQPATKDGKPVEMWVPVDVEFNLRVDCSQAFARLSSHSARPITTYPRLIPRSVPLKDREVALIESDRKAVEESPQSSDAHIRFGQSLARIGRYEESVDAYRKAVSLDPNRAAAYYGIGMAQMRLGDVEKAVESFKQSVSTDSEFAPGYYGLGEAYARLNKRDESIEALKRVIYLKPDHADAHYFLGATYGTMNRPVEAADYYKKAISINPEFYAAHINLGNLYFRMGRNDEAIESFKIAIRTTKSEDPNLSLAYLGLGNTYVRTGRYEDAIESYKHILKLEPNSSEAYSSLGSVYRLMKRYDEAIEALNHSLSLNPGKEAVYYMLGLIYVDMGNKASALEMAEQLKTMKLWVANCLGQLIKKRFPD